MSLIIRIYARGGDVLFPRGSVCIFHENVQMHAWRSMSLQMCSLRQYKCMDITEIDLNFFFFILTRLTKRSTFHSSYEWLEFYTLWPREIKYFKSKTNTFLFMATNGITLWFSSTRSSTFWYFAAKSNRPRETSIFHRLPRILLQKVKRQAILFFNWNKWNSIKHKYKAIYLINYVVKLNVFSISDCR